MKIYFIQTLATVTHVYKGGQEYDVPITPEQAQRLYDAGIATPGKDIPGKVVPLSERNKKPSQKQDAKVSEKLDKPASEKIITMKLADVKATVTTK